MAGLIEDLRPRNAAELAEALAWAAATRTPLDVIAGGTKRALGAPPRATARLCVDGLAGVLTYEPEELVLTARPGTPLREIEALLAGANQMLAFEPPDWGPLLGAPAGGATLGGVVACNASGPRRMRAGAARDHMLGIAAVSGRGEPFKAGGKVVKNVTGYDLPKLLAGSYGTLAVMTEVTLKVLPRPESARSLLVPARDAGAAVALLRDAASLPYEASGLAFLPAAAAARLGLPGPAALIRLEGAAATLPHRIDGVRSALGLAGAELLDDGHGADLWRALRDVAPLAEAPGPVWRVSVPPAAGPAVAAASGADLHFYDWAGGLVWLATDPEAPDGGAAALRAAVARAGGGHATLFRAPEALRRAVPVFEPEPPPLAALTARVKAAFDPFGLLNPGRLVPIS